MKALAIFIWVVLVVFLGVILWPSEVSNLKALWGSTYMGMDGFGDSSAGVVTEPPLWFLMLGITILAMVYTGPGLMFICAKSKVAHFHEMWRLRKEAKKLIAESEGMGGMSDESRKAADIGTHFNDKMISEVAAKSVAINAIKAYEKAVYGRIEAAKSRLNGVQALSSKERNECIAIIKAGESALKSVTAVTV